VQHRRQTHRAHGREHRCSPPTTPPHDRDQGDIGMPTADARPPRADPRRPHATRGEPGRIMTAAVRTRKGPSPTSGNGH
jgi:hypothetical protein